MIVGCYELEKVIKHICVKEGKHTSELNIRFKRRKDFTDFDAYLNKASLAGQVVFWGNETLDLLGVTRGNTVEFIAKGDVVYTATEENPTEIDTSKLDLSRVPIDLAKALFPNHNTLKLMTGDTEINTLDLSSILTCLTEGLFFGSNIHNLIIGDMYTGHGNPPRICFSAMRGDRLILGSFKQEVASIPNAFVDSKINSVEINGWELMAISMDRAFDSCMIKRLEFNDCKMTVSANKIFTKACIGNIKINQSDITIVTDGLFNRNEPGKVDQIDISGSRIRIVAKSDKLVKTSSVINELIAYDADVDEYDELTKLFRHVKIKRVKTNVERIQKAWEESQK